MSFTQITELFSELYSTHKSIFTLKDRGALNTFQLKHKLMPGDSVLINNKADAKNTYDAIVIGSGISGGWAAKELTEKGLRVLMLERGRPLEHIKDYKSTNLHPWQMPHRGKETEQQKQDFPVASRDWAGGTIGYEYLM